MVALEAAKIEKGADVRGEDFADPRAVLTSIGEVIYDWVLESDQISWGANVCKVLEIPSVIPIATGQKFAELTQHESGLSRYDIVLQSEQRDGGHGIPYQLQYAFRSPRSEQALWLEDTGRWFAGPDGRPARAHGVVRVINERHATEEHLLQLTRCDALTGQLNRARLTEVLEDFLVKAKRKGENFGFLLASIDNLAIINTSYGFDVADEVISKVADRIHARMRGQDILGRYSGNKFGVVLTKCDANDLPLAAERFIRGVMDEVIVTSAGPVSATLTVGGVYAPRYARSVAEVMQRAHETLDEAKKRRRGGFAAYSPSRERDQARRHIMQLSDEVLSALNERRLMLAYQPIADSTSGDIKSYECLARIQRANGDVVSVGQVIPLFEKLGLVRLIDIRVLEMAMQTMIKHPNVRLSVNVSAETAADPDWRGALMAFTRQHKNIHLGERLTLELTETAVISNVEEARDFIATVREQGCQVALDDFGSGHTSFKQLRALNVDYVKIDGVFVQNIARSGDDRFFVRTLVDLARHVGAKTVAEWVQDEDSVRILRDLGVDYLQGTHIGDAVIRPSFLVQSAKRSLPRKKLA